MSLAAAIIEFAPTKTIVAMHLRSFGCHLILQQLRRTQAANCLLQAWPRASSISSPNLEIPILQEINLWILYGRIPRVESLAWLDTPDLRRLSSPRKSRDSTRSQSCPQLCSPAHRRRSSSRVNYGLHNHENAP